MNGNSPSSDANSSRRFVTESAADRCFHEYTRKYRRAALARSRTSEPSFTVAIKHRGDIGVACKSSLTHVRQATTHGIPLRITQPVYPEMFALDNGNRLDELI